MDSTVLNAHQAVRAMENELDAAIRRRQLAFALANEKGMTSGDIARLTGCTPMQALHLIRVGHQLINRQRAQDERRAA